MCLSRESQCLSFTPFPLWIHPFQQQHLLGAPANLLHQPRPWFRASLACLWPQRSGCPRPLPVLCAPCAVVSGLQFLSWGPCVQASLTDHPEGGSWTEVTCSWFVKAFFSSEGLYWHSCLPAFEIFFHGQKWELGISSWKATVNSGVLVETHSSSRCICVCC